MHAWAACKDPSCSAVRRSHVDHNPLPLFLLPLFLPLFLFLLLVRVSGDAVELRLRIDSHPDVFGIADRPEGRANVNCVLGTASEKVGGREEAETCTAENLYQEQKVVPDPICT